MQKPEATRFNLKPLEVIRDLLRQSAGNGSIGEAPQAVKVYQFMNSADVGFFWPSANEGRLYLSGRPLLDYERSTIQSVVDVDTTSSTWCSGNTASAAAQLARANQGGQHSVSEEDPADPRILD
jgi:hypothetical protein